MFEIELKNHLVPVIFEENNDLPILYLKLVFKNSGKVYEGEVAGLAKMFARLLNEGVDEGFFKRIETKAISLSASSNLEYFELSLSCLKEHFSYAMKELKSLLLKPQFDENLLEKLKKMALGELASKNSDFDFLAKTLLNQISFNAPEFKYPSDGDEKSIAKISLKALKSFYEEHFNLNHLIVVAGGAIKDERLSEILEDTLEDLPLGAPFKDKSFKMSALCKDAVSVKKQSEQAFIYFASPFELDFKDEELYLAKLAFFVLGAGGFGSRLMEEIRVKRGLAYSAYAVLDINRIYTRSFGYLQTKNENAKEAKSIVKALFKDFVKKGVSEGELEAAKKFLIGSSVLRYESLEKRLNIAFSEFYNGLQFNYFKKELESIEKASLKALNAFIQKHAELEKLSFASIQNEN